MQYNYVPHMTTTPNRDRTLTFTAPLKIQEKATQQNSKTVNTHHTFWELSILLNIYNKWDS